jgi:hypothetical protein
MSVIKKERFYWTIFIVIMGILTVLVFALNGAIK